MKSITVNPSKVNLAEQDIEDWLYENPTEVKVGPRHIEKWLARQLEIPSGRIDLLGLLDNGLLAVVEVKNVEIDSAALAQVCRYAYDIDMIGASVYETEKIVIGKGDISSKVLAEAEAMEVKTLTFDVHFLLRIDGPWGWKDEYVQKRDKKYHEIAALDFWKEVKRDPYRSKEEQEDTSDEEPNEEIPAPFQDFLEKKGEEDSSRD